MDLPWENSKGLKQHAKGFFLFPEKGASGGRAKHYKKRRKHFIYRIYFVFILLRNGRDLNPDFIPLNINILNLNNKIGSPNAHCYLKLFDYK